MYLIHPRCLSLSLAHINVIAFSQRQKLIALHQSQIQAYHVAAKKALMEWANSVTLPEINISIHDTVTSYIKSCRAVTIAARPIWRDATVSLSSKSSSTSAKKELPVNEMAMNIIEERAKAHFEKQQENKERASQHNKTTITMENIPEEGEEDEDGEIDESDNTKDIVAMDATEEGVKNDFNNDTADTDDGVINEDGTNASTAIVSSNSTEVKVNATKTKPIIPLKKNIVSLHNKSNSNKPHQPQSSQTTAPPPSKRSVPTTKAKSVPIKKTNVTKPMTSSVQQQYRNNNATMNNNNSNNSSSSSHRGNTGGRGSSNIHNSNNNPNIGRSGGGLRGGGGGGGRGSSGSGK